MVWYACGWTLEIRKEIADPTLINDQHRGIQRGNSRALFTAADQEPQKKKLKRKTDGKEETKQKFWETQLYYRWFFSL